MYRRAVSMLARVVVLVLTALGVAPHFPATPSTVPAGQPWLAASYEPPSFVRPDTTRDGHLVIGYDELMRRYGTWRRVRTDEDPSLALGVLVVDETVSKLGGDFYRLFQRTWTPPNVQDHYVIAVREQPLPNRGTRVEVRVNGHVTVQLRLQPRREEIEQATRYAVARTARFIEVGGGRLVIE